MCCFPGRRKEASCTTDQGTRGTGHQGSQNYTTQNPLFKKPQNKLGMKPQNEVAVTQKSTKNRQMAGSGDDLPSTMGTHDSSAPLVATSLMGGVKNLQVAADCSSPHWKQRWGVSGLLRKCHHRQDDLILSS